MNTILIFRFDCNEPSEIDQKIFSKITKRKGETLTVETTPHGVVIVARTSMSVGAIFFHYKVMERHYDTLLPVFVFNLTEPEAKNSASFFNLNRMSSIVENVTLKKNKVRTVYPNPSKPKSINELLEQIHEEGLDSLSKRERRQLDEFSKKLNNNDKNN